ncbi:cytidine deaminase [Methylocystis sp.]|jgi:cytidine deaminase|uniref:cytidine deaminase n=1 Tax=Methylocystis sp. TaxID=1911079 RepID=UPI003D109731
MRPQPQAQPKSKTSDELDPQDRALLEEAAEAAETAYAPYSKFSVGAAVRTRSGKTYKGSNLENAAYGVAMCAEVAALTAANTAGDFDVVAIAVLGHPAGEPTRGHDIVTPCGRCRQMIYEASWVSDHDVRVICANGDGSKVNTWKISELLPSGFGPSTLGIDVKRFRKASE